MAEPLKDQFGPEVPRAIAGMVAAVWPGLNQEAFVVAALAGYADLSLTQRAQQIARALHAQLPADYPEAVEILIASLGPKLDGAESFGMAPFRYLPHVYYVATHGLDHFAPSMRAQYELTQRFTAEFSIRPFLERHTAATLAQLRAWTADPSVHVRRLVSEGTRPRLPWAPRLRMFQRDPQPVLELLELLKDDPELYVRRSVANNLNDIGKDHPALLAETAERWLRDAPEGRRWLVRHALRSAVKRADTGALAALGYGEHAQVAVGNVQITPAQARIGGAVTITFELTNTGAAAQRLLVDLRVHYVKAGGRASPKVFKLISIDLAPQAMVALSKKISLAQMTTRTHYPGTHQVDVVLNGSPRPLGAFELG